MWGLWLNIWISNPDPGKHSDLTLQRYQSCTYNLWKPNCRIKKILNWKGIPRRSQIKGPHWFDLTEKKNSYVFSREPSIQIIITLPYFHLDKSIRKLSSVRSLTVLSSVNIELAAKKPSLFLALSHRNIGECRFFLDIPIPVYMWEELFTDSSCGLEESQNDLLLLWKIFYPPPFFKCHIDWWVSLLVGLFTHINNSC